MKKVWPLLAAFALVSTLALQAQQQEVKVATDPEKAGPDYKLQGEYVGETAEKAKLGAEVIARGAGKFEVNFLPGGLRGEGGDYSKAVTGATGKTEDGKVTIASKDGKWTGVIDSGKLTGKTAEGQAFTLNRIVRESKTLGAKPPEGAIILFDGKDTKEWKRGGEVKMVDGNLLAEDIQTIKTFKDHKIHLEFRLTYVPFATGQGRSNSGVYIQNRYECQVLDSFGLKGENNECGGFYTQAKPLVNMCYPPLQWQTYDIDLKAAKFDEAGKKVSPAVATVHHNGVLIHDKFELKGPTPGNQLKDDAAPGPIFLQGHGGQVQYRNIWVVENK